MKFYSFSRYSISSFIIIAACCLQQCCLGQSTTARPYKFGFTLDEPPQHRREMKDERGIVMGEFGFITADGIYHVTVYATDEQGRFRILAMKNYPYESPPKTLEVMVKPKVAPTTTTTAKPKPLTRHNFNTEACSGCFLANGNNKPKGLNEVEGKIPKNDIRPLSKDLPGLSDPKFSGKTPSSPGKIIISKDDLNILKQKSTTLKESVIFKDFNAFKNVVTSQHLHTIPSTLAPKKDLLTTFQNAQNKFDTKTLAKPSNEIVTKSFTLQSNKGVQNPYTYAPTESSTIFYKNTPFKEVNTLSLQAANNSDIRHVTNYSNQSTAVSHKNKSNKEPVIPSATSSQNVVKSSLAAPNKVGTTTSTDPRSNQIKKKVYTSATKQDAIIPSSIASSQNVVKASTVKVNNSATPSTPSNGFANIPLESAATQMVTENSIANKDFTGDSSRISSQISKTHLAPKHNVLTMTTIQAPATDITNVKDTQYLLNDKRKSVAKTFKTPLKAQTLQISNNAQLYNAPTHTQSPQLSPTLKNTNNKEINLHAEQSIISNNRIPLKTKPYKFLHNDLSLSRNNLAAAQVETLTNTPSIEKNLNTYSTGQIDTQLPKEPVTTEVTALSSSPAAVNTQTAPQNTNTTSPVISKKLNPKTSRTSTQGGSTAATGSKTLTGNPPPIMDIIMQEVLPTLMGKNGKVLPSIPAQSTSLNSKSNAASGQKPGSSKDGFDIRFSGSPAADDDGDLYRFKYTLDYNGHTETGKRNGNKEGSYFVISEDNVEHSIEYVANELGYQPRVRWRKLDSNEIKPKENTLKDYEFVWFHK